MFCRPIVFHLEAMKLSYLYQQGYLSISYTLLRILNWLLSTRNPRTFIIFINSKTSIVGNSLSSSNSTLLHNAIRQLFYLQSFRIQTLRVQEISSFLSKISWFEHQNESLSRFYKKYIERSYFWSRCRS